MRKIIIIIIAFLFVFSSKSLIYAADPVIKLYGISDYAVTGSAYDPDCPSEPIDVHVYHDPSEGGTICRAAYLCPDGWPGVCFAPKTGFWCLYRHPVNSSFVPNNINVAAINKCGSGSNVWADKSSAVVNVFHTREFNTIFIDKPSYKIGISKKFGAAIMEYYNKRVDPTLNFVQPDPGSTFQAAIFGTDNFPLGSAPNCVGTSDIRYNPTQAGSHCAHPNGSYIRTCVTENGEDCLGLTSYSGKQLTFAVHFKNFYYPGNAQNNYPYQDYDDVWGEISYIFDNDFVKVDYKLWKTSDKTYGVNFQQLPIAFLTQLTKFTYKNNGSVITDDAHYNSSRSYSIDDPSDGRWVTVAGSTSYGATPASPNDFVTLAFYNKPYKGACQPRKFQMDYLTNDGGVQYSAAIQNNITFQAEKNYYIEFQAYVFPYKYNENLPGANKTVGTMADSYEPNGGFMPDWECNIPTPIPGDITGPFGFRDGKVNIYDYNLLITDFGKTGNPGFIPSDIDGNGIVDIYDYNTLVGNFGRTQ